MDARADHIFPYRIPDYVQYRYVKVWYFRWMPQWMFRILERMAAGIFCLDWRSGVLRFGWGAPLTRRKAWKHQKGHLANDHRQCMALPHLALPHLISNSDLTCRLW